MILKIVIFLEQRGFGTKITKNLLAGFLFLLKKYLFSFTALKKIADEIDLIYIYRAGFYRIYQAKS